MSDITVSNPKKTAPIYLNPEGHSSEQFLIEMLETFTSIRAGDYSRRMPLNRTGLEGKVADAFNQLILERQRREKDLSSVSEVLRAMKKGDFTQRAYVETPGLWKTVGDAVNEIIDLNERMAVEFERISKVVGKEGKITQRVSVGNVSGSWKKSIGYVNSLIEDLVQPTNEVARVIGAVAKGDLTRSISVEAKGEVASLKDNINEMIRNLKDTTHKNTEQDWLKTNLAKFNRMLQGQRDLETASHLILSELAPLVSMHQGAFYLMDEGESGAPVLSLVGSYAHTGALPSHLKLGEGLIGQCAAEKKTIFLNVPTEYLRVRSALGEACPAHLIILPVLFEGHVKAVLEIASFKPFGRTHIAFLEQLTESIGIVLNTIAANMRTEELLKQSQSLTQSLQNQQNELKETNEKLEEKARLLFEKMEEIEGKNQEVELAKKALEEKADQLALTSKYKSQFLANMSHELRTPLNSLLILAKMLAQNSEGNLTEKQVDFAKTVYSAGSDLPALINEILDMSKIESGMITVEIGELSLPELTDYVGRNFRQIAQDRGLEFHINMSQELPKNIFTDSKRLQQVLKNLLSNAFKFTEKGSVSLEINPVASGSVIFDNPTLLGDKNVIAFSVIDTGIGIPLDKRKIIFEAFQQADMTTSRKYGGAGLGLTISREIAKLLGGEIQVEGAPGEGSIFTLYLPAHPPHQSADSVVKTLAAAPSMDLINEMYSAPRVPAAPIGEEIQAALGDDRESIMAGDKVILIVEDNIHFSRVLMDRARVFGFKVLITQSGVSALALARKFKPHAVTLDLQLPDMNGWRILDLLKHDPETRHIPVNIISVEAEKQRGLKLGALACLEKPVTPENLERAFGTIKEFVDKKAKSLLIVEDDEMQRKSILELIHQGDIDTKAVATGAEALAALEESQYDCMILDLGFSDMSGFDLLDQISKKENLKQMPIIIYTGKELSRKEESWLRKLAKSIILKDVQSPEILLEEHHIRVLHSENGRDAIELLKSTPGIDLVLMDVMMPGIDGFETAELIRSRKQTAHIPIIFLTASSINEAQVKMGYSLGAVDFIHKPIVPEILKSKVQVFVELYKKTARLKESEEALRLELAEHQRAQEARKESDEKYRALFSRANDAIIVFDASGCKILDANKAALKLYGYTRKEFLRLTAADLAADPQKAKPVCCVLAETPSKRVIIRSNKAKDGRVFPAEISHGVVSVGGMKIVMALTRDISEREQAEEAARLRQMETMQRQFVAMVSHELRTPITAIKGFTETLRRGAIHDPKSRMSFIKIIEAHADKLGWLIEDLLTLSEIESNKHKCERVNVPLFEYVRNFVLGIGPLAAKKSVTIQINIDKDLHIWMDQAHLSQILQNLVDNAIKYNKKGGSVLIEGREAGRKEAVICVRDTGIGFSAEELPLIFQQFHRSENARLIAEQGTGLGLYIIKRIVELNGGRIWAESRKDAGSSFYFTAPLPDAIKNPPPELPAFNFETRKFVHAALNSDKVRMQVDAKRPMRVNKKSLAALRN